VHSALAATMSETTGSDLDPATSVANTRQGVEKQEEKQQISYAFLLHSLIRLSHYERFSPDDPSISRILPPVEYYSRK
jgi:hypothetical protein